MLITQIPATIWPGQRPVGPDNYPAEQKALRADVATFLNGHFRIVGDRLFVIPPDRGFLLTSAKFMLNGPGHFAEIHSEPAFDERPFICPVSSVGGGAPSGSTLLRIGMTQSEPRIYSAIALHKLPNSTDELIGYFQLEPLVLDPVKGL